MPKVSVVMSSYNHDKFVAKAIQSVLDQGFKDFEFLIIDDQSKDRTFEIEQEFEKIDPRIKVLKSPHNRGMVQNTNELIQMAQGEYIAIINSDDFWSLGKLEKQVKFLDNNSTYGACFTDVNMVDEDDKIILNQKKNPFIIANKNRYEWLNHWFYSGNCLCYPSSLARKSCYEKIGFFNPTFICLLDFDMWIRICLAGFEIYIIPEKLTNFRLMKNESNLSGLNKTSIVRVFLESQRVLYNYSQIKDFDEFAKIFPNYSCEAHKGHPSWIYLIDLMIKDFFVKKIQNGRNVRNFMLYFLQEKISENHNVLGILEKEFNFSFKKYLEITGCYPNGISVYKSKNKLHKHILKFGRKIYYWVLKISQTLKS